MTDTLLTSLVLKENVTIIDVESNSMFGQFGFMAKVFTVFERHEVLGAPVVCCPLMQALTSLSAWGSRAQRSLQKRCSPLPTFFLLKWRVQT
jgi:hypothetical protein